jgi:hypothetical protein
MLYRFVFESFALYDGQAREREGHETKMMTERKNIILSGKQDAERYITIISPSYYNTIVASALNFFSLSE